MRRLAFALVFLATPALAAGDPATAVNDFYGVYSGSENTFGVDIERYLLQFNQSQYFNLSIGRGHTASIRLAYVNGMDRRTCPAIICCGGRVMCRPRRPPSISAMAPG